jgi:glycerol kinase
MTKIVAIDQGTTSTRTLVLEADGSARIAKAIKHAQHFPQPGWVEHDPEELVANILACLQAAGSADAVALSNQGESCLAWDAITGEPLSPVIVWQDNRTSADTQALGERGFAPTVLERAGLPLDPYFSASKLRWLIDNVPAVQQALQDRRLRLGTTDAFFLQRLTGTCATDPTTASRTSLMNLATLAWDEELCRIFGVPIDCLPDIRPSVGHFGTGPTGPLTAAVTDQQAALYGHGCRKPGDLKITFGTGAFCLALADRYPEAARLPKGLLPTVAWQIGAEVTYALDGGVYDVGAAIEWAIKSGIATSVDDFQAFERPAAIERGVAFIPAFSGLACPYWDRTAAPLLVGLSYGSDVADMRQALVEGIVFLTADVIAAMGGMISIGEPISIDGGLSRSAYFCQFLADITGRTIKVAAMDEITALGAAQLAAVGIGTAVPRSPSGETRSYAPRAVPNDAWRQRAHRAIALARGWHD